MATTSSSLLQELLSHCRDLHNGLLNLKQLVPVHQSLCQCHSKPLNASSIQYDAFPDNEERFESILRRMIAPDEWDTWYQLLHSKTDAERLLAIQYLMRSFPVWKGLGLVLVPFLILSHERGDLSDDLSMALLECIPREKSTLDLVGTDDSNDFNALIAACRDPQNPIATRILVRLVQASPSNPTLIHALCDRLYAILTYTSATKSVQDLRNALSSLSKDVLPLLTTKSNSSDGNSVFLKNHLSLVSTLWYRLNSFYESLRTKDDHYQSSLLGLTTVLCPLLPCLMDQPLPDPTTGRSSAMKDGCSSLPDTTWQDSLEEVPVVDLSKMEARPPKEQQWLWDLIYVTLSQGLSLLEDPKTSSSSSSNSSLLRKRGLYLLRLVTSNQEYTQGKDTVHKENNHDPKHVEDGGSSPAMIWNRFCMCLETLEMESEQHLIEQIWDSVKELVIHVANIQPLDDGEERDETIDTSYNRMSWKWINLLLSHVVSSERPIVRKLGIYRLLKGQVGIVLDDTHDGDDPSATATAPSQKRHGKKKSRNVRPREATKQGATVDRITSQFLLTVLLPAWDSFGSTIGYTMHLENNRKVEKEDMIPLFVRFLQVYVRSLQKSNPMKRREFWQGIWSSSIISNFHTKNVVLIYKTLSSIQGIELDIPTDDDTLQSVTDALDSLFQSCSVLTYRREILQSLATMLAQCHPISNGKSWSAMTILKILALFSADQFPLDSDGWNSLDEPLLKSLRQWIGHWGQDGTTVGATVATAFVGGLMLPNAEAWDPSVGTTKAERDVAWSIPLLCTLAVDSLANTVNQSGTTVGSLLWPAIHKGLSHATGAMISNSNIKADQVSRAMLLLESGCKLRQLSGLGNGDLVVDRQTQQLMPPPPNIEAMLSLGVSFILYHIRTLVSTETSVGDSSRGSVRSTGTRRSSATFALLIAQIRTLQQSFPSSMAVSSSVEDLFSSSMKSLTAGVEGDGQKVMHMALIYAALSSGADSGVDSYVSVCRALLPLELSKEVKGASKAWEQMARSILQYSKWGSISCIIPRLLDSLEGSNESKLEEVDIFLQDLFESAFSAVEATPAEALLPLFNCVVAAGKRWLLFVRSANEETEQRYLGNLQKIIRSLFHLMEDCNHSIDSMYMLNEICALVFHPQLLFDEYERLERIPDCATPIRDAFRMLIEMAGTHRPHITRSVLCRITVGWLGIAPNDPSSLGLSAVPYREDIVKLLIHKEMRVDEAASNQSRGERITGVTELPPDTDELSITRGFVLVFLSKLPDIADGLSDKVLKDLLHHTILHLLKEAEPKDFKHKSLIMRGTPMYCVKMRAWQALCNLTRFVTDDIAKHVCECVFKCMEEPLHGQIRYFVEIFTIQCARRHSEIFGPAFVKDISRCDLSLQHISSLVSENEFTELH